MAIDPQRLKELFLSASEMASPAERAAFLEQECGADVELRQRVEALLRAHDASGGFLNPEATGDAAPPGEAVGSLIGPYKLVQKLGEGGMGTVWVAEQSQPVKRRVALKVIKPGMDSAQVIRRFEAERQALALMDHTHIAKVFDAGTTAAGRPYFVMELVPGVHITRYCDELNLPVRERLALFVSVCQATQHAHQKGIIHRDIKPSNVLVCLQDGRPMPKVIDFGVAKAMGQRLTDESLTTDFGAVIGTLEYMSPEQAEISPLGVDTRADVYALGALLYELLTGTTPLDRRRLRKAALAEVLRLIREEEPPRPSTRLTDSKDALAGVAAQRRTEPARLTREVRGELDWIVMKCLEKDRTRRYDTASGLAKDIAHHLADEPVEACPPSAGYRLRKFARRHRGPVAVATVVLLALVARTVAATWGLIRARQAREEALEQRRLAEERRQAAEANARDALEQKRVANQEKAVAEAVRAFLERDLLRQANPTEQADTLRQAGPESAAYALAGLGQTLLLRQKPAEAEPTLRGALAILAKQQPDDWKTFHAKSLLGEALLGQKKYAEAEPLLKEGYTGMKQREAKIPPPAKARLAEALERLVQLYEDWGKPDQAAWWKAQLPRTK